MSDTMLKKLNDFLNESIEAKITLLEKITESQKNELEEDYTRNFILTAPIIYRNTMSAQYLKALQGPSLEDPLDFVKRQIGHHRELARRMVNSRDSLMSAVTSIWKLESCNYVADLLDDILAKMLLLKEAKVAEKISVNFWDDYLEEKGTHAYVEELDIPSEFQVHALKYLVGVIKNNKFTEENVFIEAKLKGEENNDPFIKLPKITYGQLEGMVAALQKMNLTYQGIPFHIYSES